MWGYERKLVLNSVLDQNRTTKQLFSLILYKIIVEKFNTYNIHHPNKSDLLHAISNLQSFLHRCDTRPYE